MKGFFYGLGLGVALGVLFAPMSGEETRGNLKERAGDLGDNARQLVNQGADKAKQAYSDSAEKLRTGVRTIREQASDAVQSAANATKRVTGTERATGTDNV